MTHVKFGGLTKSFWRSQVTFKNTYLVSISPTFYAPLICTKVLKCDLIKRLITLTSDYIKQLSMWCADLFLFKYDQRSKRILTNWTNVGSNLGSVLGKKLSKSSTKIKQLNLFKSNSKLNSINSKQIIAIKANLWSISPRLWRKKHTNVSAQSGTILFHQQNCAQYTIYHFEQAVTLNFHTICRSPE